MKNNQFEFQEKPQRLADLIMKTWVFKSPLQRDMFSKLFPKKPCASENSFVLPGSLLEETQSVFSEENSFEYPGKLLVFALYGNLS